jgi:hypothetical protein
LTPHGSKIATTVAILSPLFAKKSRLGFFLKAKSPQGESYNIISVSRFIKTYRRYGDLLAFEAIQYSTKFALANLK